MSYKKQLDKVGQASKREWSVPPAIGNLGAHCLPLSKPSHHMAISERYSAFPSLLKKSSVLLTLCLYCSSLSSMQYLWSLSTLRFLDIVISATQGTRQSKKPEKPGFSPIKPQNAWTRTSNSKRRIHQGDYAPCILVVHHWYTQSCKMMVLGPPFVSFPLSQSLTQQPEVACFSRDGREQVLFTSNNLSGDATSSTSSANRGEWQRQYPRVVTLQITSFKKKVMGRGDYQDYTY